MSDLRRCETCQAKFNAEANQTCPNCGTVYVPPEPYGTPVTPEQDEADWANLFSESVKELRRKGWTFKRIDSLARSADSG